MLLQFMAENMGYKPFDDRQQRGDSQKCKILYFLLASPLYFVSCDLFSLFENSCKIVAKKRANFDTVVQYA